ncbi:MAG: tetratricopeptide repeat protein [Candidatus Riflebacteria bacterium]|nr:tetratricopeptide repeat protein [Candidatus Riflebacteria bacterium]
MHTIGMWRHAFLVLIAGGLLAMGPAAAQTTKVVKSASRAIEAFDHPGMYPPQDLYKWAREAFQAGQLDDARLYALRIYFDGLRTTNLLDLLGTIEAKAGYPLLAGEWLRKSLCLNFQGQFARKLLAQLPPKPRPIPVPPDHIQEHFTQISSRLPQLLARLNNQKLHFNAVLNELARGQFYKALALAEEFEKRYPGVNGTGLTALCAMYLGRGKDAMTLIEAGLKKNPHHPFLLFGKAMLQDTHGETAATSRPQALYDLDRWTEAREEAAQFNQMFPRSVEGFLVQARLALDQQKVGEAQAVLEAAARIDPGHPVLSLLMADACLASGQFMKAGEVLQKAFLQGYNLPSVSLKAGLLAVANGRLDEATTIIEDARNSLPFSDRDAWPLFVQLALYLDNPDDARLALDQWAKRFPRNSLACYLEGFYWFKMGQNKKALDWIRKGFAANPDRVSTLRLLTMLSALEEDPDLAARIKARVAGQPAPAVVPNRPEPPARPAATPAPQPEIPAAATPDEPGATTTTAPPATPAAPPAATITGAKFTISAAADVDASYAEALKQGLDSTLAKLEPLLGEIKEPIEVSLIAAAGMGSRVAMYDPAADTITVTALFFDPGTIKALLEGEKPNLSEEDANQVSQWLPFHSLTREMALAVMLRTIKGARETLGTTAWMQRGLAELLGGSDDVLKELLVSTQARIASDEAKLGTAEELNQIFADRAPAIARLEAARAQAYLMVAFLVKKGSDKDDGLKKFVKLLEAVCGGRDLDGALRDQFGLSKGQFDSAWKEAAYWSLRQGLPYEW